MQQDPSSEANSSTASQKTPHVLWNLNVHYRIHKRLPCVPILSHIIPLHASASNFWKTPFNIIIPSTPSNSKCSPAIAFFLIWSTEYYLVRSTYHKAPRYVVFSTPLSPRPSYAQISPSALILDTPSASVPPSLWETKFHTHTTECDY